MYIVTQAEQIRAHLVAHYIDPARRKGETLVTVTAGQVHKELGLRNRVPNVCQAMESRILEREAQVKVSSKQGPPSGRGTTFTITYAVEIKTNHKLAQEAHAPSPATKASDRVHYTPEFIEAFYALRGIGKETYAKLGGGEAFLKKERAAFYGPFKRKKML